MTTFSPLGVLAYGLGGLTALAVIAGGIILFVVGKGRGALSGAGFVVLGIGTIANTVLSLLLPQISLRLHLATAATGGLYSGVSLFFSVIGWGLVIAALFRFRGEEATAPGGGGGYPPRPPSTYPPPPPGGRPGPYGQPGWYGRPGDPPPAAPGQGHSVPGPGPERPPYGGPPPPPGQDRPNPGWGGPPYGTEGPPPPPGY